MMQSAWGQGSTSSRITGQITDGNETLIGANVIAVHEPTGFQYGTMLEGHTRLPFLIRVLKSIFLKTFT